MYKFKSNTAEFNEKNIQRSIKVKNSHNIECILIHYVSSRVFFDIYNSYSIVFKDIIAIQYFSYENIGGQYINAYKVF